MNILPTKLPEVHLIEPKVFGDAEQVEKLATPLRKNGYGQYLFAMLKEKVFRSGCDNRAAA